MDNINNLVADKLIRMQLLECRKQKKITQEQLHEISGLSVSCISSIENTSDNNTSPTLRTLIRYANALGVNIYIG